jgi:hypothetical protein
MDAASFARLESMVESIFQRVTGQDPPPRSKAPRFMVPTPVTLVFPFGSPAWRGKPIKGAPMPTLVHYEDVLSRKIRMLDHIVWLEKNLAVLARIRDEIKAQGGTPTGPTPTLEEAMAALDAEAQP